MKAAEIRPLPPVRIQKKQKTLSTVLFAAGALILLLGVFCFLIGDLQLPAFASINSRLKSVYAEYLSTGQPLSFGYTAAYYSVKFAVVVMLIGLLLLLNAYMLLGQHWERYRDFTCVLPALIALALFVYYPLLDLVRISFTNWNLMKEEYKFVGIKNYKWLFAGSGWKYLKNTLWVTLRYTFWEVFFSLAGGLLLALLFDRMTRYFNALRALVFMPKYIATSTSAIIFVWMLNGPHGIVNWALGLLGIVGPDWLANSSTALAGILMLTFWRTVGYAMMIYLSAMKGIPQDYYEAASIDDADKMHCFRFITLPMLAPTTLFLLVTTFISSMKVFQSVDVMTSGGPYDATMVMVQWVYNLSFKDFRVDRAAAASLVFFLVLLAFTTLTMKYSNKNVNYDQ